MVETFLGKCLEVEGIEKQVETNFGEFLGIFEFLDARGQTHIGVSEEASWNFPGGISLFLSVTVSLFAFSVINDNK